MRDYTNERHIRQLLSITGLQIKYELMGVSCFPLNQDIEKKKEIMCSRSFSQMVDDLPSLQNIISNYISDAAEKMRRQHSLCMELTVFARTNPFQNTPQFFMYETQKLKNPTCDTHKLIEIALKLIEQGYKEGYQYKKAGIRLSNFFNTSEYQIDFLEPHDTERDLKLMNCIDHINYLYGSTIIKSMACGTDGFSWRMNRKFKSPRYTTHWSELMKFKA